MNPNLFKSAEFYHRRYHNFATLFILPLVLLLLFLVFFSLLAKKEVTLTSQGEIQPTKIIASIQSTSNHEILDNKLVDNHMVKKGDFLIYYAKNLDISQKEALNQQLSNLEKQKMELETLQSSLQQGVNLFTDDEFGYSHTFQNFVSQSRDIELGISKANTETKNQAALANNTLSSIDEQISHVQQQITDYQELQQAISNQAKTLSPSNPHQATLDSYLKQAETSPSAREQFLSQIQQNISNLESSQSSLSIQRAGLGTTSSYDVSSETKIDSLRAQFLQTAAQDLAKTNQQITELRVQRDQASEQLEKDTIQAPETGIIHLNREFEGKNLIPIGSDIAQIYPDINKTKEVLITYYVTSAYVSLLKEKQVVRLILEKIGNQPTIITGRIQSIDQTATPTEQGNLFKVTALSKLTEKEKIIVQYGLQGRVTSIIAKKTYFDYYKDKFLHQME